MGQIRKRGTFYQIRYYRNGRRIEETTEHTKYDDARDLLRAREDAISKGVPLTAASTKLTFDDAVKDVQADYVIHGRKSKDSLDRRITLHLLPAFGGRRLSSISAADLGRFAERRLSAHASPAEINRELAIISRAFRLAVKYEKYHGRVPAFTMLAEDNVRVGFVDRDSVNAITRHLPAALQPVVRFAYVTGWRIRSEVLPLEWRQVDRKSRTARLDPGTTKNKKGRSLDYGANADLCALFEALWREHETLEQAGTICPLVFQRGGKRIKCFRNAWTNATRAAGCPGRIPHDLRRSAVRNLVRSGVPDTVAMKITGHRSRAVFDRYDITSDADVRDGLGRLESATGTERGDNRRNASADANAKRDVS